MHICDIWANGHTQFFTNITLCFLVPMQDILISFALAGGHCVGGSGILQECFSDEKLMWSSSSHTNTIERSLIASAVSAVYVNPRHLSMIHSLTHTHI